MLKTFLLGLFFLGNIMATETEQNLKLLISKDQIEDEFVIGYGLNYKELYRGLPGVYVK